MSSAIKLYEHNQKAYDALLDMLGECDRACVIKPTGTGKFVIFAKMVQDNPDKRFLLLGTNDYMFNDQMANLAEIAPGFTPENLQFMTYSAAMMAARRGEEISGYDVVVVDEFHRCGAEEWGKGVTHILDANESAKVVGFSATPIRYSDGGRNMADEMFDGNVAYSMELEEAWLRGILPIPKYVTAFYEAPKELGRLAKSIAGIKDEMVMKRFEKKYENLRRSLTEAGGVREAIAKHLKKRDAKVIVFCPRVAKLREFMLLRRDRKRMMRIFRSREDGMHLRGDSVREIPFMLFLGLLFAVTVGWWVFLTLTVSVVFGNVAAAVFAVCSALSVTVGYGLVRASDSRE